MAVLITSSIIQYDFAITLLGQCADSPLGAEECPQVESLWQ
ncbi:hypothetical protein SNOG_13709 [Parastagonospora nodorum SN15]|uniref:Uncharacterized protein n=1 Tax=Phaeosphaeria nodorum (strain SN15 / ATCC MYA-4574 / FGSC 10173) TaxID=321614 RepID=Q0U3F5_PHANO|nr:hypothetical protein SNOG_13709 [Parastagonospora nodorum SN15]EAT78733.1 hypothetical protein SNOG_13709 [Parastagonospora nodorum SN15]